MASVKDLRTKPLSSMSSSELKAYIKAGEKAGYTLSTSKDLGKAQDLLKVMNPSKYDEKQVASATTKLQSNTTQQTQVNLGIAKTPKSEAELPSYLSDYQSSLFDSSSSPETRESIVNQIKPEGIEKPETLNRVAEYEKMRTEMGVADLETSLTDLKSQLENEYATKRARTQNIEGKPVAMGVIAGRVSEVERQETERIDAIGRQINVVSDQLNTSYNVISTYMNFMGLDYQDSVEAYNTEYNRNLQIYQLVDAEMDEQVASARSNLQIYQNAITAGNISYSSLSSDQRSFINKLEVQSGLPVGFTASLRATDANGKILSTTTRESGGQKYVDIVMQMPDGSMEVKTQSLGASSDSDDKTTGSFSTAILNQAVSALEKQDIAKTGSFGSTSKYGETQGKESEDKLLSPKEVEAAKNAIRALVDTEEEAINLFNRAMAYGDYDFYKGAVNE